MINLTEFIVQEMKSDTYLAAAKRAKEIGDPRAQKFLDAYKDALDKELAEKEGNGLYKYYKEDKSAITKLKALSDQYPARISNTIDNVIFDLSICSRSNAFCLIELCGDDKTPVFLRKSIIGDDAWKFIMKKHKALSTDVADNDRFTLIRGNVGHTAFEFFYLIDVDAVIPTKCQIDDKVYTGAEAIKKYDDDTKEFINKVCSICNKYHKNI